MRKHAFGSRKLRLARESIRIMVSPELRGVAGGFSCGRVSACDCSTGDTGTTGAGCTLGNCGTEGCTRPQY